MIETIQDVLEKVTLFDYIYIVFTILLMIRGAIKGFVLSILSAAKWILAYVLTIYIFPKVKPYVEDILDNEYVLDLILGIGIFVIIIFLILMINKAISKAVSYSGIGTIDKVFGLIFGIFKSYVLIVCLFTAANVVYNYDKWPFNLKDSFTFPWVEKGSKYLIKEFPNEKEYQDAKEKVQDIYNPKLKEECGVFGISNSPDASTLTALGLHALQHRGQEGCGIVSFDGEKYHSEKRFGLVGDNFNKEKVQKIPGKFAIGHNRYSTTGGTALRNVQPFFADTNAGGIGVAHNGNLTNAITLRNKLVEKVQYFTPLQIQRLLYN